jgi:hypothetical protein
MYLRRTRKRGSSKLSDMRYLTVGRFAEPWIKFKARRTGSDGNIAHAVQKRPTVKKAKAGYGSFTKKVVI